MRNLRKEVLEMTYTINPDLSFSEVIVYYQKYLTDMKKQGKTPVSFLHFITGRY
jgi:hypothetical protein